MRCVNHDLTSMLVPPFIKVNINHDISTGGELTKHIRVKAVTSIGSLQAILLSLSNQPHIINTFRHALLIDDN